MNEQLLQENVKAEDVLNSENLDEYQRAILFFRNQLLDLHTNVYLLEQILSFPIGLFVGPDAFFFRQVIINFFDMSVLIIMKLTKDQGQGVYTLGSFKNKVRQFVKSEYRASFQERVRTQRLNQRKERLLEKTKRLRDQQIAHALVHDYITTGTTPEHEPLSFSELKTLKDELTALFRVLSFNSFYSLLPGSYNSGVSSNSGDISDIEQFLDGIARNSYILNLPERDSILWQSLRSTYSDGRIKQINHYRRKFGLKEV